MDPILRLLEPLAQFGAAGLMGVLWVWERSLSRKRETQLDEAHQRILSKRSHLRLMFKTLNRNSRVIERFDQTQRLTIHLLEQLQHDTNQATNRDHPRRG